MSAATDLKPVHPVTAPGAVAGARPQKVERSFVRIRKKGSASSQNNPVYRDARRDEEEQRRLTGLNFAHGPRNFPTSREMELRVANSYQRWAR